MARNTKRLCPEVRIAPCLSPSFPQLMVPLTIVVDLIPDCCLNYQRSVPGVRFSLLATDWLVEAIFT